ncbi:MAG: glycosyltransferase family 4 protein [Deltaproteobacteria bacterium]|nr:glycosyltransferase family 4 protein [Deltaproteobacteria bacterium]
MHVVQLITKPQRRGAELFALDLSTAFTRLGVESTIVCLYRHNGEQLPLRAGDVRLEADEHSRFERLANPLLVANLVAALARLRPDVVQANGGRSLKYAAIVRPLAARDAAWVYRNIDSPAFWLRSWRAKQVLPRMVTRTFDGAVCVSRATLDEVRAIYGFEGTSAVIENGVDFSRLDSSRTRAAVRAELALDDARPIALWAGALSQQKRPDRLVRLLASVPDLQLVVIGEGPYRQRLEAEVGAGGFSARTRILGNRADVGAIMRSCDFLIVTSDTEGMPAVVLEAQHCGLPVISYDVGGIREAVSFESGILVSAADERAFAEAVSRLVHGVEKQVSLSENARVNARRFDVSLIAARYLAFYADIVARRRS